MAQTQKSTRDVAGTANSASASCWAQIKWQANKPGPSPPVPTRLAPKTLELQSSSALRKRVRAVRGAACGKSAASAANWQILKCEFLYALTFARVALAQQRLRLRLGLLLPHSWSIILTMKMASGFPWHSVSFLPAFSLRHAHIN